MSPPVVLVAEDSLVVRALLRAQLQRSGYVVVEAEDGHQALARAEECSPDAILLDVEMPGLDGFEVLSRLKALPGLADVPVVFISGRTESDDAIHGLHLGAHDYLRKPFAPEELAARVQAAVRTKRLQDQLRDVNAELLALSHTDQLTGLPNRRLLDEELRRQCSRAARHRRPLSLLMLDVDHFKAINDRHGHRAGDAALVAIARRLRARLRTEDMLGRWGGEEFMIITPDVARGGFALAELLRAEIADRPLSVDGEHVAVTISVGWAGWQDETPEQLVQRADEALYRAKEAGRNRVEPAP